MSVAVFASQEVYPVARPCPIVPSHLLAQELASGTQLLFRYAHDHMSRMIFRGDEKKCSV